MQVYAYTDEIIDRLDAFARDIPAAPSVGYYLMHPEVHVPSGYLPIKVTQYYQHDSITWPPKQCHWAIFIPTSSVPGIGHYYELAGHAQTYHIKSTINAYYALRGQERGSHIIGYVLPAMLPYLEAHFALTPVETLMRNWDGQNWIVNALQGLDHPHMFAVGLTLEDLVIQMAIVRAAWEAEEITGQENVITTGKHQEL